MSLSLTKNQGSGVESSAAFSLATAFYRSFHDCADDENRQRVCREYRDKTIGISRFADIIAAALNDAFPESAKQPGVKGDSQAWAEFTSLVQRHQKPRDHQAQRLQHQIGIVAIWGIDIFQHYSWHELPLDNTRLLHRVAHKLPQWDDAVELIDSVMLERHERRVVQHDNRAQLIGEHPRSSRIQDVRSPVERKDIEAALKLLDSGGVPNRRRATHNHGVDSIGGTPIRNYGLEHDKFGMIVPRSTPGVVTESRSPCDRATKRRKVTSPSPQGSGGFEDPPMSPLLQQPTPASASTIDSEMTEFEEDSCDGPIDGDVDGDLRSMDDRLSQRSTDSTRYPDVSTDVGSPDTHFPPAPGTTPSSSSRYSFRPKRAARHSSQGLQDVQHETAESAPTPDLQACNDMPSALEGTSDTLSMVDSSSVENAPTFSPSYSHRDDDTALEQKRRAHDVSNTHDGSAPPHQEMCGSTRSLHELCSSTSDEEELCHADPANGPPKHATTGASRPHDDVHEGAGRDSQIPDNETPQELEECIDGEISAGDKTDGQAYLFEFDTSSTNEDSTETEDDPSLSEDEHRRKVSGRPAAPARRTSVTEALDSQIFSLPTELGRFIPATVDRPLSKYCTDTSANTDDTIVDRMANAYSGLLRETLGFAQQYSKISSTRDHDKLKVEWLESTRWANVHAPLEDDLRPNCESAADADVWYMKWDSFRKRADDGELFRKPIVIKQEFKDSGMHEVQDYVALLSEQFPGEDLDVHDSEMGACRRTTMSDFCTGILDAAKDGTLTTPVAMSNAINLRRIANADAPLLTRLKRFRLLETLTNRVTRLSPGKRTFREANDISECLGFDLLGFAGAFTRPHVDALMGTWIRCLSGAKVWIFAPDMNNKDWDDFAQDGPSWTPGGKGRAIILGKDDVLLMPPGLRVLHTVFTLEPSLMEGGMLWDEYNIPALLDELFWVAQNQSCTNEAIAYQLPSIINALEVWIRESGERLSAVGLDPDYITTAQQGIRRLQDLGCKCVRHCDKNRGCHCSTQQRRCTAWCVEHPTLPGHEEDKVHHCMHET